MTRLRKRDVRSAIGGAREMLARNADPIDTFEGILDRTYIRNLRTLVLLAERFLATRKVVPFRKR